MNARKKVCRNVEIGHRDANKKWHEAEALEVVVSVIALFACPASSDLLRLRCMLEACFLFESGRAVSDLSICEAALSTALRSKQETEASCLESPVMFWRNQHAGRGC